MSGSSSSPLTSAMLVIWAGSLGMTTTVLVATAPTARVPKSQVISPSNSPQTAAGSTETNPTLDGNMSVNVTFVEVAVPRFVTVKE